MKLELSENYQNYIDQIEDLYIEAFPKAERKPLEDIINLSKEGIGRIITILYDNKFAGLFINLEARDGGSVLIDYFAIKKEFRGKSLGSKSIKLLDDLFEKKTLIIEIEPCEKNAQNLRQRIKRKKFYKNLGFRETGVIIAWFGVELELMSLNEDIDYENYISLLESIFPKTYVDENIKQVS